MAGHLGDHGNPQTFTLMRKSPDCPRTIRLLEIHQQLRECATQIAYWTHRRAQAELREDRNESGARLLAWQSNQRCQVAALNELTGKAAA